MALAWTIDSTRYTFASLRDLLTKASPARSGDALAGVAAQSGVCDPPREASRHRRKTDALDSGRTVRPERRMTPGSGWVIRLERRVVRPERQARQIRGE